MRKPALLLSLPLLLTACGPAGTGDPGYDASTLAAFRAAVPTGEHLLAAAPDGGGARAVGDPAVYPQFGIGVATGINGAVGGIVGLLRAIVDLPPTFYSEEEQKFLWGPWPNDNGAGTVAAYIQRVDSPDFDFVYLLLRGTGNDITAMTPVIWGLSKPDPEDERNGAGLTVWDFEADYAFTLANDPAAAAEAERGRFVALYAAGPDEQDPANRGTWVVSMFRNFIDSDKPDEVLDADYLYGNWEGADGVVIDFLDFLFHANIDSDPARPLAEDVAMRMAFINHGWGRAEVLATGGDLTETQNVVGTECWDQTLARQYLLLELVDGGSTASFGGEGEESACGPEIGGVPIFASTLDTLQIPSREVVEPQLWADLETLALTGDWPAEQ